MYQRFYGLREKPFSLLPDAGFLYPSRQHQMAITLLEYSLLSQTSFTVVTGAIGTGKTTLIRHLLNRVEQDVTTGLITNTHPSFGDLLQWILLAFGLDYRGKGKVEMFQTLVDFLIAEYAQRHRTVLVVDEAQNLSTEALEELRMLSNINADKHQVLQMILMGQPGLRTMLRRPDLEQFAQRIAVDYHIEPLDEEETQAYIGHRLKVAGCPSQDLFTAAACSAVYENSNGIPRLINLLCDTALVYGFAGQRTRIDADIVETVASDKRQGGIFPTVISRSLDTPMDKSTFMATYERNSARQVGHAAVPRENRGHQSGSGPAPTFVSQGRAQKKVDGR
jgi:putative secretion ATPase (PEP-CTERM system associated)